MNQSLLIVLMLLFIILGMSTLSQKYESFATSKRKFRGFQIINSPWIITMETDSTLHQITKKILERISHQTKREYVLDNFDNVVEDVDTDGNRHMVIDLFAHQINHQVETDHNRRFIIDLTILDDEKRIRINTINLSNARVEPNPDQILNPHLDSADDNAPLILTPESHPKKPTNIPIGATNIGWKGSSLDYGHYKDPLPKRVPDTSDVHKWIVDESQQKDYFRYPCYQQGDWWDGSGIELNKKTETKLKEHKVGKQLLESKLLDPKDQVPWKGTVRDDVCQGQSYYQLSASAMEDPLYIVPQKYPLDSQKDYDSDNHWNFDLLRGITTFPRGISNKAS